MEGLIDPGVGVETLTRRPTELPWESGWRRLKWTSRTLTGLRRLRLTLRHQAGGLGRW